MASFYQTMTQIGLSHLPRWTISGKDKKPIDPIRALKLNFNPNKFDRYQAETGNQNYWGNLAQYPNKPLATLDQLKANPNTPLHAYSLSADLKGNGIMLIDIEKVYDHSFNPYLRQLPYLYGERSRHGGLHFIVKIPKEIRQNKKYQDLFSRSNIKFGTIKDQKHTGIEIFFHHHYLTFTENQIPVQNNNTTQNLINVLDYLSKIIQPSVIDHEALIHDPNAGNLIPNQDVKIIANHVLDYYQKPRLIKFIKHNHDADDSHREYLNINQIAHFVLESAANGYRNNPFTVDSINNINHAYDAKELVWVVIYIAQQYMPFRDKWLRYYSNRHQTYLQRIANDAFLWQLNNLKYFKNIKTEFINNKTLPNPSHN